MNKISIEKKELSVSVGDIVLVNDMPYIVSAIMGKDGSDEYKPHDYIMLVSLSNGVRWTDPIVSDRRDNIDLSLLTNHADKVQVIRNAKITISGNVI